MPRPTVPLPTAADLYAKLGSHPPWHTRSTKEVADLLGTYPGVIWNWNLRGYGIAPEADGLHIRASTRRFFFPCLILEWLSQRQGDPVPAWTWCRTWLAERRLLRPDAGPEDVLAAVRAIEKSGTFRRKWRVRKDRYEARLTEILGG